MTVDVHVYPIELCGKGRSGGKPCNRKAAVAHIRADVQPPLVLWMCRKHNAEAVADSVACKEAVGGPLA